MKNISPPDLQTKMCGFLGDMLSQVVTPDDDLRSKGLDSVGYLELIIFLEKQLDIPLPLQLLSASPITSVADLTKRIVAIGQTDKSSR
jgi:acyl carrier protein